MDGLGSSPGTLSVVFHHAVGADDVPTPLTGGMKAGRQVLNNGAELLMVDVRHHLEAMRQLQVQCKVGWIQEQILARHRSCDEEMTISSAEGIRLSRFANKRT